MMHFTENPRLQDQAASTSCEMVEEDDAVKRYFERPSGDSQQPLDDPLKFNPGDQDYRLWCNCRVLHGFFLISSVQAFFVCGIIVASLSHLIYEETRPLPHREDILNSSLINQSEIHSGFNGTFPERSAKLVFEISEFFPYFRLLMSIVELTGLIVAYYGIWCQQPKFITPLIMTGVLAILASLIYVLMLTWHCVKKQDYFTFCFVGLTLLFLLLANVLGVHCAVELRSYLYDLSRFVASARRRWPNVVRAAMICQDSDQLACRSRCRTKKPLKKRGSWWDHENKQPREYQVSKCHMKASDGNKSPSRGYLNEEYMIQVTHSQRSMDLEAAEGGSSGLGSSTQDPEVFGPGSRDDVYRTLRNHSGDSGFEATCSRYCKPDVIERLEEECAEREVTLHLGKDWLSRITPKSSLVFHHYYISRALVSRARLEGKRFESAYDLDSENDSEYEMERGDFGSNRKRPSERYSRPALQNGESVAIRAQTPTFNVKDICVPI